MTYMIESQVFKGEMYIKASEHHRAMSEAVAAEREACAKVCEAIAADNQRTHAEFEWPVTIPKGCASAIRARGAA